MRKGRIVGDFGNTNLKARSDGIETEITIPHAILELDPSTWKNIMTRANGKPPDDYACINGSYYAFGESAERHGTVSKRTGSQKFTENYYGVILAYMSGLIFNSDRELSVFASHAPGDIDYRDDLLEACGDMWQVEIGGQEKNFAISHVNTFEEPVGGVMNVVLTKDGTHYANPKLNQGRVLTIDIGGGTVDFSAIFPNGQLDYSLQISLPIGFNAVYDEFVRTFRSKNAKLLKQIKILPPDRVREAIRTGVFRGGGLEIACQEESDGATYRLLNEIAKAYAEKAGGPINWDFIVATGGGPVPLWERLTEVLNHGAILKAEDDCYMHVANIRGGLKLMYMYESLGLISNE